MWGSWDENIGLIVRISSAPEWSALLLGLLNAKSGALIVSSEAFSCFDGHNTVLQSAQEKRQK